MSRIRQAIARDVCEIVGIWSQRPGAEMDVSPLKQKAYYEDFGSRLKNQNHVFRFWVALDAQDNILGWVSLQPCRNNPALINTMAEISIYVSPHAQNRGIGLKLLQHALSHAETTPLEWITGYMASTNRTIIDIAKYLGFSILGQLPPIPKTPERPPLSLAVYQVPG